MRGADKFDRQGDMAVRLALGETHLVKENKEYFEKEGVDISVLESAKATGGGRGAEERSSTVILVKNLPYSTEAAELAKRFGAFGDVSTTTCMLLWDRAKRISLSSGGGSVRATCSFIFQTHVHRVCSIQVFPK